MELCDYIFNMSHTDKFVSCGSFRVSKDRSTAVKAIQFKPLELELVGPRPREQTLAVCTNNGGDEGVWWKGCVIVK